MKELSLHILDIAQNSVTAGATRIEIEVTDDADKDILEITISDNGCGMDGELLKRVTDPFTTSRKTRKVGLGIPLMKLACEQCGGGLDIRSEPGRGTVVTARFGLNHIDRAPMGDISDTLAALVQGSPEIDWVYRRECRKNGEAKGFIFSAEEARDILGGEVPLNAPDVISWIVSYIRENEEGLPPL